MVFLCVTQNAVFGKRRESASGSELLLVVDYGYKPLLRQVAKLCEREVAAMSVLSIESWMFLPRTPWPTWCISVAMMCISGRMQRHSRAYKSSRTLQTLQLTLRKMLRKPARAMLVHSWS